MAARRSEVSARTRSTRSARTGLRVSCCTSHSRKAPVCPAPSRESTLAISWLFILKQCGADEGTCHAICPVPAPHTKKLYRRMAFEGSKMIPHCTNYQSDLQSRCADDHGCRRLRPLIGLHCDI